MPTLAPTCQPWRQHANLGANMPTLAPTCQPWRQHANLGKPGQASLATYADHTVNSHDTLPTPSPDASRQMRGNGCGLQPDARHLGRSRTRATSAADARHLGVPYDRLRATRSLARLRNQHLSLSTSSHHRSPLPLPLVQLLGININGFHVIHVDGRFLARSVLLGVVD